MASFYKNNLGLNCHVLSFIQVLSFTYTVNMYDFQVDWLFKQVLSKNIYIFDCVHFETSHHFSYSPTGCPIIIAVVTKIN